MWRHCLVFPASTPTNERPETLPAAVGVSVGVISNGHGEQSRDFRLSDIEFAIFLISANRQFACRRSRKNDRRRGKVLHRSDRIVRAWAGSVGGEAVDRSRLTCGLPASSPGPLLTPIRPSRRPGSIVRR